jgi:hypothetical protein
MKTYRKYILIVTGIVLGAVAGFAYWYFVGCSSGTCAITSVWYRSAIYGSIMGGLLANLFISPKEKKA